MNATAHLASLSVCMYLAASRLLDTPRSSVLVSQVRCVLAQKFTVIIWYEGAVLAISMCMGMFVWLFGYFSCQRSGMLKALSLSQNKLLCRRHSSGKT